jgi:hypothetical protein
VTLSVSHGTLTLASTTGLTFTTGDGTSDATIVFTGTLTNINNALSTVTYNKTASFVGADTLTFTTNDQGNTGAGGAQSTTSTVTIDDDSGNPFTLTTGADTVFYGSGSNQVSGTNTTATNGDNLTGGSGVDTLTITDSSINLTFGNGTSSIGLKNFETIKLIDANNGNHTDTITFASTLRTRIESGARFGQGVINVTRFGMHWLSQSLLLMLIIVAPLVFLWTPDQEWSVPSSWLRSKILLAAQVPHPTAEPGFPSRQSGDTGRPGNENDYSTAPRPRRSRAQSPTRVCFLALPPCAISPSFNGSSFCHSMFHKVGRLTKLVRQFAKLERNSPAYVPMLRFTNCRQDSRNCSDCHRLFARMRFEAERVCAAQ